MSIYLESAVPAGTSVDKTSVNPAPDYWTYILVKIVG